jgi:hypothetical protein
MICIPIFSKDNIMKYSPPLSRTFADATFPKTSNNIMTLMEDVIINGPLNRYMMKY